MVGAGSSNPVGVPECGRALEVLAESRLVHLVTHWDADGVASAALLVRNLVPRRAYLRMWFPRIGSYSADAVPLDGFHDGSSGVLVLLDYGIVADELERLASRVPGESPIIVIDHHATSKPESERITYCNPVGLGVAGEREYPSASMLVYLLAGGPRDDRDRGLALLGVAGDLSPFIESGRGHAGIDYALRLLGLDKGWLEKAHEIAARIDSCYRVFDYECLWHAVHAGVSLGVEGLSLLREASLAAEKAGKLLEEALSQLRLVVRRNGFSVYHLIFDGYVTSAVGRRLASARTGEIPVLVHFIPRENRGFIYVRSLSGGLTPAILELRRRELRVGGKDAVLVVEYEGIEYPEDIVNTVIEAVRRASPLEGEKAGRKG